MKEFIAGIIFVALVVSVFYYLNMNKSESITVSNKETIKHIHDETLRGSIMRYENQTGASFNHPTICDMINRGALVYYPNNNKVVRCRIKDNESGYEWVDAPCKFQGKRAWNADMTRMAVCLNKIWVDADVNN